MSYSPLNMVIKLQYKMQHDMAVPEKLNINSEAKHSNFLVLKIVKILLNSNFL